MHVGVLTAISLLGPPAVTSLLQPLFPSSSLLLLNLVVSRHLAIFAEFEARARFAIRILTKRVAANKARATSSLPPNLCPSHSPHRPNTQIYPNSNRLVQDNRQYLLHHPTHPVLPLPARLAPIHRKYPFSVPASTKSATDSELVPPHFGRAMVQGLAHGARVSHKDGTLPKVGSTNRVGSVGKIRPSLVAEWGKQRLIIRLGRASGNAIGNANENENADRARQLYRFNRQKAKAKNASAIRWIPTQPRRKKQESALCLVDGLHSGARPNRKTL